MRLISPARLLVLGLALAMALPAAGQSNKSVSLGVGVIASPRPYEGADSEITPIPILGLRYKAFYFETIRMGLRGRPRPHLELDAFLAARFEGFEADDSPVLAGMADRDISADFGASIAGKWDAAELKFTAMTDILDESDGQELQLSVGFPFEAGRWRLKPSATVSWLSKDHVAHYYGVRLNEVTPDRPAYTGDDTINFEVGFQALRPFNNGWTLRFDVEATAYGDDIKASPIVEDDLGIRALAAAFYTWGR